MSILAIEPSTRTAEVDAAFVGLMLGWAAAALALVVLLRIARSSRLGRSLLLSDPPPEDLPREHRTAVLPVFAAAIVCGFAGWLTAQVIFASIAPPRVPVKASAVADAGVAWRPVELAFLMLLAGTSGWGATLGVLRYARADREAGYTRRRLMQSLGAGVIGIFVAIPAVFWTLQLTLFAWRSMGIPHASKHPLLESMGQAPDPVVIAVAGLAAIVTAPLFEELIFRGLIQNGLTRLFRRPWLSILLASMLFAMIHPWWTIPPIFVLSLLLGFVYHRTGNLWSATLMHALFNAFAMATSALE